MNTQNLNPLLVSKVQQLLKVANGQGLSVDVFSDFRSMDEQQRLYNLGRTVKNPDGATDKLPMGNIVTEAKPGQSWHNWGLAVDIVFKINRNWDWGIRNNWDRLGQLGENLGLVWGGHFPPRLIDKPHFELTGGLTIAEAQELEDINDVWDEVAKRLNNARIA